MSPVALVTGAASGIGAAACAALRAQGFLAFGLDLRATDDLVAADVTDPASVAVAVAAVTAEAGGIDVPVNNAGVLLEGRLADLPLADLDRILAVNVRGAFVVAQAVLPHLRDSGRIVNVASDLGYLGRAGASAYAASKGAVLAMTRSWARELAPRILVNAVAPGPIDTPLLGFDALNPAERALETANPLGRVAGPRRSRR